MTIRRVYRLGVIELGPDWVRYYNNTASGGPYPLTPEQRHRWFVWLTKISNEGLHA